MKKISCMGIFIMCSIIFAHAQTDQQATLQGKLLNFSSSTMVELFDDHQMLIPKSSNPLIMIAQDGQFSLSIPMDKPTYYRIGRNKLYLSPGDNLDLIIDNNNNKQASFKGKGSEVNNYLKNAPFPKGGSYIEAGTNIKETPEATILYLKEEAERRLANLHQLKGVSQEFIYMETGRIRADYIKSLMAIPNYASYKLSKKGDEMVAQYLSECAKLAKPLMDSLKSDFVDARFLKVEVYRDIVYKLDLDNATNANEAANIKDWLAAVNLAASKIIPENDKTKVPAFEKDIAAIKSPEYRNSLEMLLKDKLKFANGDAAIDLTVNTTTGVKTKLSSLKGKVIYIDIWATWCGPCIAEMPYLDSLKMQYAKNPNLAIVSLSIDDTDKIWLNHLKKRKPTGIQWRIDRPDLTDYNVNEVPRYILIDRDFKIASMDAPRASDSRIQTLIDTLLGTSGS